jgi:hypothetical protein
VGAPLLCDVAKNEDGNDRKWIALRRRRAVWALANLGNNLHRFQELSSAEKEMVLATLESEVSASREKQATAAKIALDYLKDKQPLHVDETLVQCAGDQDPFLRVMVAFALKYWDGPQVERTLWKLSGDPGHGEAIEVEDEV